MKHSTFKIEKLLTILVFILYLVGNISNPYALELSNVASVTHDPYTTTTYINKNFENSVLNLKIKNTQADYIIEIGDRSYTINHRFNHLTDHVFIGGTVNQNEVITIHSSTQLNVDEIPSIGISPLKEAVSQAFIQILPALFFFVFSILVLIYDMIHFGQDRIYPKILIVGIYRLLISIALLSSKPFFEFVMTPNQMSTVNDLSFSMLPLFSFIIMIQLGSKKLSNQKQILLIGLILFGLKTFTKSRFLLVYENILTLLLLFLVVLVSIKKPIHKSVLPRYLFTGVYILLGIAAGFAMVGWMSPAKHFRIDILLHTVLCIYFSSVSKKGVERSIHQPDLERQIDKIQNQYLSEIYSTSRNQFKDCTDTQSSYLSFINDLKHLADAGEYETIKTTIQDTIHIESTISKERYCDVPLLNSLIQFSKEACMKQNTELDLDIGPIMYFNIRDHDIGILFLNLLNNALEASISCIDNRLITLHIHSDLTYLYINFKNNYQQPIVYLNQKYHTTKEDLKAHGHGLKVVKEIVEHYDGLMLVEHTDTEFRVRIALKHATH
ncbi:GHKL domain-containing protein [Erysipelothrix tonsillarum]|uniref:GHKL domain-containing protein n=1 Tax=Erysipelothrix tonsillarum TaxID=38402 RepID=UPI0003713612|nr:GHKL domain-containing protein [Erysipelothrix tonsillarum]